MIKNNDEKQKSEEKKVSRSNMESLSFFLLVLSVFAAILYFVGYGVALSATSVFNIPHESLFSSTFDLLELSAYAIVTISSNFIEFDEYKNLYIEYFNQVWITALIISVVACGALVYFKKFSEKFSKSRIPNILTNIFKRPTKSDSYVSWFTKIFFYVYGLLLLLPTLVISFIYAVIVLVGIFCLVPSIGLEAGKKHIKRYVIEPTSCSPISNRDTLLKKFQVQKFNKQQTIEKPIKTEIFATCISLTKENDHSVIYKGRLVYMTTSAAILFNPDSGEVQRVLTQNMTISIINKL